MNQQQRTNTPAERQQGAEMLLFLVVAVSGIYALGTGLTGLFEPGRGLDLLWLAVAVVAMRILAAQMGRVQDSWPSRRATPYRQAPAAADAAASTKPKPLAHSEEEQNL